MRKTFKDLVNDSIKLGTLEYQMGEPDIYFGSQFVEFGDHYTPTPSEKTQAYKNIDKLTKEIIASTAKELNTKAGKRLFKLDVDSINFFYYELTYSDMRYRAEYFLRLALVLKALKETKNVLKAEELLIDNGLVYVWHNDLLEDAGRLLAIDGQQLELPTANEIFA